jgi:hypothetical protein
MLLSKATDLTDTENICINRDVLSVARRSIFGMENIVECNNYLTAVVLAAEFAHIISLNNADYRKNKQENHY